MNMLGSDGLPQEQGFVVWLTGLPCAGKSSLAKELCLYYRRKGRLVEGLDGDDIRALFPTGFSREERNEHIRRVGFIASLLERNGLVVVASFISPYREARLDVRRMCGRFIEVYVKTSLEECERRDTKGLYRRARAGEIKNFTGLDAPYEVPDQPEIVITTDGVTLQDSFLELRTKIESLSDRELKG